MIQQGFSLGDRDWYVMCAYDIRSRRDLMETRRALLASGCDEYRADEAVTVLSMWNKGFTYTNFIDHLTIVCVSKTTSAEQLYDSVQHELKHVVEHLSEYYGIDPKGETAAYLQGEVARLMFPAAALLMCPKCHHSER